MAQMDDNPNPSIFIPDTGGFVVLEKIREPYRPLRPFELGNKPRMIDPMVTPLQICMVDRNTVIGQCNSPIDENDYHSWQRVIKFFRSVVGMVKPVRPQLCFMLRGDVIGEPSNAPTVENDLNAWQKDMMQLRVRVGIMRLERIL